MCTVYGIYIVHVTLELVSSSREIAANHHVDVTSVGESGTGLAEHISRSAEHISSGIHHARSNGPLNSHTSGK